MARGLVNFDAAELPPLLGRSTRELARELGAEYEREVVHRDDLVVLDRPTDDLRGRVERHSVRSVTAEFSSCARRIRHAGRTRHADVSISAQRHDDGRRYLLHWCRAHRSDDEHARHPDPAARDRLGDAARRSRQRRRSLPSGTSRSRSAATGCGPEEVRAGARAAQRRSSRSCVSAGYAGSRAEIRYWDESVDVDGAVGAGAAAVARARAVGRRCRRGGSSASRSSTATPPAAAGRPGAASRSRPLGEIRALDGADH